MVDDEIREQRDRIIRIEMRLDRMSADIAEIKLITKRNENMANSARVGFYLIAAIAAFASFVTTTGQSLWGMIRGNGP